MIDTIVLRIHNLKKYNETINFLYRGTKEGETKYFTTENKEKEEIQRSLLSFKKDNSSFRILYHDSGSDLPLSHSNRTNLASSHYNLAYNINFQKDFVEFNFSIPKYLYSANILQFIDYYDTGMEATYRYLKDFIRKFCRSKIFINNIDEDDVEINRIDLCYNQFFPTKDDALKYLEMQGTRLKSFDRDSSTSIAIRKTGIEYVTNRYKFKIYHKGTEFLKNDYTKLSNKNTKGYNLQEMIDNAERILRYEVTYRNSFMNYAFQRLYFDDSSVKVKGIYREMFRVLKIDELASKTHNKGLKRKTSF